MAFNPDMGINQAPRRRALFGPRELASLAGGFSAPSSGGFWGGLSAGLSGSLGGASRFDVQTHEDEKDQLRRMMEERRIMLDEQRYGLEARRVASSEASDAETNRHNLAMENKAPAQESGGELGYMLRNPAAAKLYRSLHPPTSDQAPESLSDSALNMTSDVYYKTGMLPSLGMKASKVREQILERAALNHPGADVAGNKAAYGADTASLKNLQGNYDQTKAFGNTFEKNAQPLEKLVNSIPNLGFRFGNHLGRWAASQAGSSQVSQFHTQLGVVRPEAQRILQFAGTGGNMALTDHQAKDMRAILGDDFTPAQLKSSLAILRLDRENKLGSYAAQIEEIRGRLRGQEAPAASGDVEWVRDASGKLVRKTP